MVNSFTIYFYGEQQIVVLLIGCLFDDMDVANLVMVGEELFGARGGEQPTIVDCQ